MEKRTGAQTWFLLTPLSQVALIAILSDKVLEALLNHIPDNTCLIHRLVLGILNCSIDDCDSQNIGTCLATSHRHNRRNSLSQLIRQLDRGYVGQVDTTSNMISRTTGWTSVAGLVPAEMPLMEGWVLCRLKNAAAIWDRPALWMHANMISDMMVDSCVCCRVMSGVEEWKGRLDFEGSGWRLLMGSRMNSSLSWLALYSFCQGAVFINIVNV